MLRVDPKLKPAALLPQTGSPVAPQPATRSKRMARVQQVVDYVHRHGASGLAKVTPETAEELKRRGAAAVQQARKTLAKRGARLNAASAHLVQAAAQQAADRIDRKPLAQHAAAGTQPATTPIAAHELNVSAEAAGLEAPTTHDLGGRAVAVSHAWGARSEMEDAEAVRWFPKSGIGVAAVFDGHGGDWVAQNAAEIVPQVIEAHLKDLKPWQRRDPQVVCAAIADAFAAPAAPQAKPSLGTIAEALEAIGRDSAGAVTSGGATAIVAVFVDKQLYVASLGDARAVLARPDGSAQRLSSDHRIVGEGDPLVGFAAHDAETQRVLDQGGLVLALGRSPRLYAAGPGPAPSAPGTLRRQDKHGLRGINMTRALGDLNYPGLGRRPDVTQVDTRAGGVLMLGCDGMFNRVHDDAHAAYIGAQRQAGASLADISQDLIKVSHGRRSGDNMTTLLVDLSD